MTRDIELFEAEFSPTYIDNEQEQTVVLINTTKKDIQNFLTQHHEEELRKAFEAGLHKGEEIERAIGDEMVKKAVEEEVERIRNVIEESMYNNPIGERAINRNEAFAVVLQALTSTKTDKQTEV